MEEQTAIVKADSSQPLVATEERACFVKQEIEKISADLVNNFFYLGELLSEVHDNNYLRTWGYDGRFGDWVKQSGLDMGPRQAYYLIKIVNTSKKLGISREDLKQTKLSKLKEIFTLDPATHADQIKLLVEKGKEVSLDEIRQEVQTVKAKAGQEIYTYLNLKVAKTAKEQTIDPAIEAARREYGDTVNTETGEPVDISMGKAIEVICADYLADPNRQYPETIDVVPVEETDQ